MFFVVSELYTRNRTTPSIEKFPEISVFEDTLWRGRQKLHFLRCLPTGPATAAIEGPKQLLGHAIAMAKRLSATMGFQTTTKHPSPCLLLTAFIRGWQENGSFKVPEMKAMKYDEWCFPAMISRSRREDQSKGQSYYGLAITGFSFNPSEE